MLGHPVVRDVVSVLAVLRRRVVQQVERLQVAGGQLINGDGSAIANIVLGVLLDGFAVLILFAIYKAVRHWRRHRQQGRQPASGPAIG